MVNLYITSVGIDKVRRTMFKLPTNMEWELDKGITEFARAVQKSAKLRAPRFSGYLASSIFVKKKGEKTVVLEVTAPYAYEQETGEGLPRQVPMSELKKSGWTHEASRTRGGLKKSGGGDAKPGFFMKRSYKPFIKPVLEHNIGKFSQRLNKATQKVIKKK